jgi:hypothetical protein
LLSDQKFPKLTNLNLKGSVLPIKKFVDLIKKVDYLTVLKISNFSNILIEILEADLNLNLFA